MSCSGKDASDVKGGPADDLETIIFLSVLLIVVVGESETLDDRNSKYLIDKARF